MLTSMDVWIQSIYFGSMSIGLNATNLAFVYIDFMIFQKYDFVMLTSDSFVTVQNILSDQKKLYY